MGGDREATTPSTTAQRVPGHDRSVTTQPANDDGPHKSAIVTQAVSGSGVGDAREPCADELYQ